MKKLILIKAVNRLALREHLKSGRYLPFRTRLESIEYYVPTQPFFAVQTLDVALMMCREWNRQNRLTVLYWSEIESLGDY